MQGLLGMIEEAERNDARRRMSHSGAPKGDPRRALADAAAGAGRLGAAFLPGSGVADAAGYFPAEGGGFEPGVTQNVQQGNYLTALMQMAGAAGDAMYAVPALGAALKAPRAAQLLKQSKKAQAAAPAPAERTAREQAMLDKFGQKADREMALAKKVLKTAQQTQDGAAAPVAGAKKAKRGKVDADIYRTMEKELGPAAVMRAVNRGDHLKPDGRGGYVGAPRTVNNPQALGAMRQSLDGQFIDAAEAIEVADAARLGTWYDRAKSGIAQSAEPQQLDNVLDQHAVYSAGVAPEAELGFALKHGNSRALGEPTMAYRGAPMRNLDQGRVSSLLVKGPEDDYRGPNLGFKIGEYRAKNDPREPNTGLFGVNDFRAAQSYGYTTPDGKIWKGGVSPTMHPFMDGETALAVQRANRDQIGGRTDWQGPHLQEVPWVYGKAQDLYGRGKNARFKGDELEGVKSAIREANNTAQDYFYKHAGSATYEAVPGASTRHVPSLLDADFDEKLQYGMTGRWDVPTPYSLPDAPEVGAGNRDAIYSALGLRQLPSIPSSGAYKNSAGVMENNPVTVARPLLDFPTGGGGKVAGPTAQAMDAAERFRAVIDAQEAGAWNLPVTANAVKGKNALVLDSRPAGETITGRQPSLQEMRALASAANNTGYGVTATNRGVSVFPFNPSATPADLRKFEKAVGPQLAAAFPGARSEKALMSSGYVPGLGRFDDDFNFIPTAPFSGEATMSLLSDLSRLNPAVSRNLSESEGVRNIIRQKIERDAALPGPRRDIQNTRNFFAEADWSKVVDAIRKGATPAAALAAAGYSASSLAADE